MGQVLGIVYCPLTTHPIKKAGFTRKRARTGAVTLKSELQGRTQVVTVAYPSR